MTWESLHEGILEEFAEVNTYRHVGQDVECPWEARLRHERKLKAIRDQKHDWKRRQDPAYRATNRAKCAAWRKRVSS